MKEYSILNSVTDYALQYLNGLGKRRVYPDKTSLAELEKFSFGLPESSTEAEEILGLLNTAGSVNTVATNGGSLFWFCVWRCDSCFIGCKLACIGLGSKRSV